MTAYKILIADDEEDLTWGISKSLKNTGLEFDIECVQNGDEALERLKKVRYDLLISDLRMPGRDGLQLILDARTYAPDIKVILMTAYGSQEVMEKAEVRGSYFYIEKPFDMNYLKQIILQILNVNLNGFNGVINKASIRDLIELNCVHKGTASIIVSRDEENGVIFFRNGDIIHAECGNLMGERALFSILNWNEGSYKIDTDLPYQKRTILRDWKSLLYQGI